MTRHPWESIEAHWIPNNLQKEKINNSGFTTKMDMSGQANKLVGWIWYFVKQVTCHQTLSSKNVTALSHEQSWRGGGSEKPSFKKKWLINFSLPIK